MFINSGFEASGRRTWPGTIIGAGLTDYADSAVLSLTHTENITEAQGKTRRFSAFDSVTFDPRLSNIWSAAQKYFRRGSMAFLVRFNGISGEVQ